MQYSIELCHTAGSDEELSNHDAKTQTHWLLVKTNFLEPHRMVRLTSLVDRTLFVAHLMQPTTLHSVHWSVEYFIYVPWSSTCVLVVEELGQPHSGRLLLPL